jgi:hypothetical protein
LFFIFNFERRSGMLSKLKIASLSLMVVGLLFCVSKATYAGETDWRPTDTGSILVQVIALGYAVEHAEISCGESSDTTGVNGNRSFTVDPGFHTVTATGPHGGASATKVVRIRAGEFVQCTLELGSGGLPAAEGH